MDINDINNTTGFQDNKKNIYAFATSDYYRFKAKLKPGSNVYDSENIRNMGENFLKEYQDSLKTGVHCSICGIDVPICKKTINNYFSMIVAKSFYLIKDGKKISNLPEEVPEYLYLIKKASGQSDYEPISETEKSERNSNNLNKNNPWYSFL